MSGLENLLLVLAGWFADHSYPTLAGIIGGLLGGEIRDRWANRGKKKKEAEDGSSATTGG